MVSGACATIGRDFPSWTVDEVTLCVDLIVAMVGILVFTMISVVVGVPVIMFIVDTKG